MCGIGGIATRDPRERGEEMNQMLAALRHRGPDGEGVFEAPHLTMGMRRLSIIDLEGGWQPLYNEDRSLALIANGEIYNYIELRRELRHHQFQTGSDCETILHLYEEYGLDCLHHLRGMFAFALWDSRRNRLFLARDRMGEKPLYLMQTEACLRFASELKALPIANLPLDPRSVDLFFHYNLLPEPYTPVQGVRKLPAGHYLTLDTPTWQIEEHCYWDMRDAPPIEGDPVEHVKAQLSEIGQLIIRSDVPVGIALSGGLDSSGLTALAAQNYQGTLHAFTVGYTGDYDGDERNDAQALADYLKVPYHTVAIDGREVVDALPQLVAQADDPIADIAGYGYYTVNRMAREHGVPVMLQGQGGDELFWGYEWARLATADNIAKQRGGGYLAHIRHLMQTKPGKVPSWKDPLLPLKYHYQTRRRWQALRHNPDYTYFELFRFMGFDVAQARMRQHYGTAMQDVPARWANHLTQLPWDNIPLQMTYLQWRIYLLENGIAQGDRLSMASSVELRLPLVDYRLVETVIGLRKTNPDDFRGTPKQWLRAAMREFLPEWVMQRPKRGFTPPVRAWQAAIMARYSHLLVDGYLVQNKIISAKSARIFAQGLGDEQFNSPIPYKALYLEMWCRAMLQ